MELLWHKAKELLVQHFNLLWVGGPFKFSLPVTVYLLRLPSVLIFFPAICGIGNLSKKVTKPCLRQAGKDTANPATHWRGIAPRWRSLASVLL
jgi:hypothetical protein